MKKLELGILSGTISLAVLCTVIKIGIVTLFTTGGVEYSQVEVQRKTLETENLILKEKIFRESSYLTIAAKASAAGFVPSDKKSRLVLTNPAPIAFKQ